MYNMVVHTYLVLSDSFKYGQLWAHEIQFTGRQAEYRDRARDTR